jgi:hypothetical protein
LQPVSDIDTPLSFRFASVHSGTGVSSKECSSWKFLREIARVFSLSLFWQPEQQEVFRGSGAFAFPPFRVHDTGQLRRVKKHALGGRPIGAVFIDFR